MSSAVETIAVIVLVLAAIPFVLGVINLCLFRPPPPGGPANDVSVLIPARNEETRIKPVLDALLASTGAGFEIVVADDNSTDRTASIVSAYAGQDARVRLVHTPALPDGWMGKNHACQFLAENARHDVLLFLDADVIVAPDFVQRIASLIQTRPDLALISGFPRLITGTVWEKLVIPLINFVLTGYLPFAGMRFTNHPAFATACGQFIAVRKPAYEAVGGHGAIRANIHDGVFLSRRFRAQGQKTDLFDITGLCATRMYDNRDDLFAGLRKNAHEGMATPIGLPVWTLLLGVGQVLPPVLLLYTLMADDSLMALAALATALSFGYRFICTVVFRQSWTGAVLHPLGVALLLWIQWTAFIRRRRGEGVTWKERIYQR